MSRYAVRIGSAFALSLLCVVLANAPTPAAQSSYAYHGKRFSVQTVPHDGGPAVSIDDSGLQQLLDAAGATLTWDPDDRYVLIAMPGPIVASFAIGDPHYTFGSQAAIAAFAPYLEAGRPYLPARDVMRVLNASVARSADQAAAETPVPEVATQPPAPYAAPESSPAASPAPSPAELAQVTAVTPQARPDGVAIRISVSGNAAFDWHRLRPPDNRFWIDIQNARLTIAAVDEPGSGPVSSLRAHQENPTTVRVALSLAQYSEVSVIPDAGGLTIAVANRAARASVPRAGSGSVGSVVSVSATPNPSPKATYVARNMRLIVLDPGHGGSDPGTVQGDVTEKFLNLDISLRVRRILLAHGWQVLMTRSTDKDVYGAFASAHDELQARDDVANANGARVFLSIHANSFINAGPHGVTTYYFHPDSLGLAQAIDRRVASETGIKDNGVVKDKLYVVNHADMPAALIETAFMSNPDDLQMLSSAEWRERMAQAIADGLMDYLSS